MVLLHLCQLVLFLKPEEVVAGAVVVSSLSNEAHTGKLSNFVRLYDGHLILS